VQKSQPYLDRLQILAQSSEPLGARARFEHDFASAYVRLYAGDLQGTLDQIHRITQVFETYPEDLRTDTLTGISSYYAALGRRADVVRFARALKNPLDRETMRRSLADGAELRKIMEAYPPERPPNQYWNGVSYVRAGLAQMAWRYINNRESRSYNEGYALIARGQLRLLDGDARRALEDLQQGVKLTEPMNHPAYFSGCESLGDVLWKLERKYDAIDALERCSRNYFKGIAVWAPLGEVRASLDLHLADFYRGIGQVPRAQEIERRLRSRLALADHDFPLLKELRSRN
jgi:tetratricopeptide (TPR) repeat protein